MDISTQTAVCQISAPAGVGPADPYPCSLQWLSQSGGVKSSTDFHLLIGWADSFRQVHISVGQGGGKASAAVLVKWSTDCLICGGLQLFDEDHVLFLGYCPPDWDDPSHPTVTASQQPLEVIVATRTSGEYVIADALPLRGSNTLGPSNYILLSSYQCKANRSDAYRWHLRNYMTQRGGARGYAPICFVASRHDVVVARVRDVNDRVGRALQQRDLRAAVDWGRSDRAGLTRYQYGDLLRVHLTDLLLRGDFAIAASECCRLIDGDPLLWEAWIYKFIEHHQLQHIVDAVPLRDPRLPGFVYEAVLTCLLHEHPKLFLGVIKRWGKVDSSLVSKGSLLQTLELQYQQQQQQLNNFSSSAGRIRASHDGQLRPYHVDALAYMYILTDQHERALNCYLDMPPLLHRKTDDEELRDQSHYFYNEEEEESPTEHAADFRHIFDLIEKQLLFRAVEKKVLNLLRISKPLTGRLLVAHVDKLPIRVVAKQLSSDRRLLLWYLHLLVFSDSTSMAREVYKNDHEYGDLHARQIQLYAEFSRKGPTTSVSPGGSSSQLQWESSASSDVVSRHRVGRPEESDLMRFLKCEFTGALLDLALSECERQSPPLHREIIYILARKGCQRRALGVLLTEIGDARQAIEFIESQLESYRKLTSRRGTADVSTAGDHRSEAEDDCRGTIVPYYTDCQLWDDLIDFALSHESVMMQLLDFLGICKLNPASVLSKVPPQTSIPHLKSRLLRVLENMQWQKHLHERHMLILGEDVLDALRMKNQGQRKAKKVGRDEIDLSCTSFIMHPLHLLQVDGTVKCVACSRPLFMNPGPATTTASMVAVHSAAGAAPVRPIWGPTPTGCESSGAVLVFSHKLMLHHSCYSKMCK